MTEEIINETKTNMEKTLENLEDKYISNLNKEDTSKLMDSIQKLQDDKRCLINKLK